MSQTKNLPSQLSLKRLASQIKGFPISSMGIVQYAENMGYDEDIVKFLNLFSKDRVFGSREEFLNYCRLFQRLAYTSSA